MDTDVALFGPPNVGKTTLAQRLAERTGREHHELDRLRRGYFEEIGFDMEFNLALNQSQGWAAMYQYWKVFDPYAIERFVADCRGVLDFGGGTPVCEHPVVFDRVFAALVPIPHRILLVPDPDLDRSLAILQARSEPELAVSQRYFLEQGSLQRLATHIVHTGEREPSAILEEVVDLLRRG